VTVALQRGGHRRVPGTPEGSFKIDGWRTGDNRRGRRVIYAKHPRIRVWRRIIYFDGRELRNVYNRFDRPCVEVRPPVRGSRSNNNSLARRGRERQRDLYRTVRYRSRRPFVRYLSSASTRSRGKSTRTRVIFRQKQKPSSVPRVYAICIRSRYRHVWFSERRLTGLKNIFNERVFRVVFNGGPGKVGRLWLRRIGPGTLVSRLSRLQTKWKNDVDNRSKAYCRDFVTGSGVFFSERNSSGRIFVQLVGLVDVR